MDSKMRSSEVAMAPLANPRPQFASKSIHDSLSFDSGVGLDNDLVEMLPIQVVAGEEYEMRQLLNEDIDEAAEPDPEISDIESGKQEHDLQSTRTLTAEMVSVVSPDMILASPVSKLTGNVP